MFLAVEKRSYRDSQGAESPPTRSTASPHGTLHGFRTRPSTTIPCALIGAPEGFGETIEGLPAEDFAFQSRIAADTKLVIWFVRTTRRRWSSLPNEPTLGIAHRGFGVDRLSEALWSLRCDFVATDVRESALAVGLVDYEILAVDDDWTGMKFTRSNWKALVIPAYRSSGALLELIESLPPNEFAAIIVVDDGGPVSSDLAKLCEIRAS